MIDQHFSLASQKALLFLLSAHFLKKRLKLLVGLSNFNLSKNRLTDRFISSDKSGQATGQDFFQGQILDREIEQDFKNRKQGLLKVF